MSRSKSVSWLGEVWITGSFSKSVNGKDLFSAFGWLDGNQTTNSSLNIGIQSQIVVLSGLAQKQQSTDFSFNQRAIS